MDLGLRCSKRIFFLCYFGPRQKTRETYGKEPWECEEDELAEILVSRAAALAPLPPAWAPSSRTEHLCQAPPLPPGSDALGRPGSGVGPGPGEGEGEGERDPPPSLHVPRSPGSMSHTARRAAGRREIRNQQIPLQRPAADGAGAGEVRDSHVLRAQGGGQIPHPPGGEGPTGHVRPSASPWLSLLNSAHKPPLKRACRRLQGLQHPSGTRRGVTHHETLGSAERRRCSRRGPRPQVRRLDTRMPKTNPPLPRTKRFYRPTGQELWLKSMKTGFRRCAGRAPRGLGAGGAGITMQHFPDLGSSRGSQCVAPNRISTLENGSTHMESELV